MQASEVDPELRRASQAGRRLLRRHLPRGINRWIERIGEAHPRPEDFYALGGTLGAISLSLERAYLQAGSEVRNFILHLHEKLNLAPESSLPRDTGLPSYPELFEFEPWLRSRLAKAAPSPGIDHKITILQWIDVASERLTLRRYHRPDLPRRHARVLFMLPLDLEFEPSGSVESIALENKTPNALSTRLLGESADELALAMLRFLDLLEVERHSRQGRDRVSGYRGAEMGGFYGISENVQPLDERALREVILDIKAMVSAGQGDPGMNSLGRSILSDMESALESRLGSGRWSADFQFSTPEKRHAPPTLWQRIFGRS